MATNQDEWYKRPEPPPWDIGKPQDAMRALVDENYIKGPVLDIGCGTGTWALWLAERGRQVLGIDLAPTAVNRATSRLRDGVLKHDPKLGFAVQDALDLCQHWSFRARYLSVTDIGIFHQFTDLERGVYVHNLAFALATGGTYYGLVWSDKAPANERPRPRRISQAEIHEAFPESRWDLEVREAAFENREGPLVPSWLILATKK